MELKADESIHDRIFASGCCVFAHVGVLQQSYILLPRAVCVRVSSLPSCTGVQSCNGRSSPEFELCQVVSGIVIGSFVAQLNAVHPLYSSTFLIG